MAAEVDGDLPVFEFRPLENSFSRLPPGSDECRDHDGSFFGND